MCLIEKKTLKKTYDFIACRYVYIGNMCRRPRVEDRFILFDFSCYANIIGINPTPIVAVGTPRQHNRPSPDFP